MAEDPSALNDLNPGAQRVTVSLPTESIDFLKSEAGRTGMSMADILRRSIANEKFLQGLRSNNAKLLVEQDGKPQTQLVFRD